MSLPTTRVRAKYVLDGVKRIRFADHAVFLWGFVPRVFTRDL